MTDKQKILQIEIHTIIDELQNGLVHPLTAKSRLYKSANRAFNISGVGSTLCSCDCLEAKPKTDMSQPYECAKCDKPIYKN